MNKCLISYLREKRIDSFQKLRLLLFIYQHPEIKGTSRDLAERLYLGDTPLLQAVLLELQQAGLLDQSENRYRLRNEPEVTWFLQNLAKAFEQPLSRQEILGELVATPQAVG